jgi:hypothetical protein
MKQAVMVLGLAALGATQVGCITDPCAHAHNGKDGVLNFQAPGNAAAGLQTQVTMLRGPSGFFEGPFFFTRDPSSCFTFDDADIQVTLPPAFEGESVTLVRPPGEPVQVEFKCVAPAGEVQEVGVRVVAGEEVRYEDAFDITCHRLGSATAVGLSTGTGYAVGGLVHVQLDLGNQELGGLTGFGAVPADGLLASTGMHDFEERIETFRAAAPGQDPVLQIGAFTATVQATLVDGWELKLGQEPLNHATSFSFTAWPETASGTKLDGMEECRWTATAGGQTEVLEHTRCNLVRSGTLESTGQPITQMCVTALERTACAPVAN